MSTTNSTTTIFVGSSFDLDALSESSLASPLLADGDVSFYGHFNGIAASYVDGTEASLLKEWADTGAGVTETGMDTAYAIMNVTIENTSTTAIEIPVGTLVSSASGVSYQILETDDGGNGWSSGGTGDGTLGYYTIEPGASLTVTAEATSIGVTGNLLANEVTNIGVTGATVTASSLEAGVYEYGGGTVTLTNTTSSSLIVYEQQLVYGTSGTYMIGLDTSIAGFVATTSDDSSGYYVLAAGATITVPIYSVASTTATTANGILAQEIAENAAANSITSSALATGIKIDSSSAITSTGLTSLSEVGTIGTAGANTGFFTDSAYAVYTTDQNYAPTEANVNTADNYIWTAEDLAAWEVYVNAARAQGILNLAPMMADYQAMDFVTSQATQYVRAAALYSGGITYDLPSWYALARGSGYLDSVEEEIRWATQNGLRSSITLSPETGDDSTFLSDTKELIALLQAADAMPTQIVVKDGSDFTTLQEGNMYSTTDSNALNQVANWLSSLTLTPSNSESGLETRGTTVRPDDLMTGVQDTESVGGSAASLPYAVAQIFAESASTVATVTVTLGNAALGSLIATGAGTISQGGAVFTVTGDMAVITAALQALSFEAASGALGTTTLVISIRDTADTITGSTTFVIDNALSLSGITTTLAATGAVSTAPAFVLSAGTQTATLTETITLSGTTLGSFWNTAGATVSASGSVLTLSGSAATLQAFLRQLVLVPTIGASGTETETISVTDGTDTVTSAIAVTIASTTGIAVSDVPTTYISAPSVVDAPYQDILISDSANPAAILTATVTLPTGSATLAAGTLVAGGTGTLSSNGLTYSFSGTAAQLQAALRALAVSVPSSATTSSETLTLSINGASTTTTLDEVSTDTVYVGATTSADGTYANSTIATALLATGNIGLYDDWWGATSAATSGTIIPLATTWQASSQIFGYTEGSDVAVQTITIKNSGTTAITIPVGTLASTASGVEFEVIQYTSATANAAAGWTAGTTGDGTLGSYTIAAGSSITVPVEALEEGYVGNAADNQITVLGGGITGASITASTAVTLTDETASGTVTLTNTSNAAIDLYEGTLVTGTNGTYKIGNDSTVSGYVAYEKDDSVGYYVIAAGASVTVPILSDNSLTASTLGGDIAQIQAQATSSTNTITGAGGLPTGLVIASSSAITLTGPTTAAAGVTWGSEGADTGALTDLGYGTFVTGFGLTPSETDTNVSNSTLFTSTDLASWEAYVDTMRGYGTMNVGISVTSNIGVLDISSSSATAEMRLAALYGGGIDFDLPAVYLVSLGTTAVTAMEDDIKWADANGIRSTLTLRDLNGGQVDASFMEDAKALLAELKTAGLLPSQVVVIGAPDASNATNTELANMVALYVSTLKLVPTASESGLSATGTSTVRSIMTGVQTIESSSTAMSPYAAIQVFAESATDAMTATVALNSTVYGVLSTTGTGTVSSDGSTVTITGTPAQIDAALHAISFTPASGAAGTATLDISITDSKGTIQGQTAIAVSNTLTSAPLALAALGTSSGVTTVTVSTAASQGDTLTATGGGTVTSGTFTVSGTAAVDEAALAGLKLALGTGVTAPNLKIALSGAATSFTDTGSGQDTITSAGGNNIQTGSGTTTVVAGLNDTVSAGSGSVAASGTSYFTFLGGSSARDTVTGGVGGGTFVAGTGGHSVLKATAANTILHAAGSNDTLIGGGGGGATLYGSDNNATVIDPKSGDTVVGGAGSTIVGPSSGGATINAQDGSETIVGGAGTMTVTGGTGFLHVLQMSSSGVVNAGSGQTQVTLGSGAETINGGSGAGTVYGGTGQAYVTEGTGREIYNFKLGVASDEKLTVSDFSATKDSIILNGYGSSAAATLVKDQVSTSGYSGTVLTLPDGSTITLVGVSSITTANVVVGS